MNAAVAAAPTEGGPVQGRDNELGFSIRAREESCEREERETEGLIRVAGEERARSRCNQSDRVIGAPREWG